MVLQYPDGTWTVGGVACIPKPATPIMQENQQTDHCPSRYKIVILDLLWLTKTIKISSLSQYPESHFRASLSQNLTMFVLKLVAWMKANFARAPVADADAFPGQSTVCPKVPYTNNVSLFSAIGGWIPKPFDLQVVHMCGFDLVYDEAWLLQRWPWFYGITFRLQFEHKQFSGKSDI